MLILKNHDLTEYNTFHVKAKAAFFVKVEDKQELPELISFSKQKNKPIFIIGEGSNVLFTKDLDIIVAKLEFNGQRAKNESENEILVNVDAGKKWDDFVRWTVENDLYGVVNMSYIPGTVGAAPVQNIGAYGVEVGQNVHEVNFFDTENNKFSSLSAEQCDFGYRNSIFKTKLRNKAIITDVVFKLSKQKKFNLNYKDLKPIEKSPNLSLKLLRLYIGKIRFHKLPSPTVIGNAGSFFKNPIITKTQAQSLLNKWPQMPHFILGENVKIPAGWLIDNLGLKGFRMGQAAVYEHNALVLVNLGNATGAEIVKLANFIQQKVYETYKIRLEPEVNIL